jgi:hypothetical protein
MNAIQYVAFQDELEKIAARAGLKVLKPNIELFEQMLGPLRGKLHLKGRAAKREILAYMRKTYGKDPTKWPGPRSLAHMGFAGSAWKLLVGKHLGRGAAQIHPNILQQHQKGWLRSLETSRKPTLGGNY